MTARLAAVLFAGTLAIGLALPGDCADDPQPKKPDEVTSAMVTVSVKDAKVKDILDSITKQSKQKFVVESTVKGTIPSVELTDVTLETALSTLSKLAKIDWRKVYIAPDSKLLEQPDKFAATVRLMSGLNFPDMVLGGSSAKKVGVHFEDKRAVESAEETATRSLGMTCVYLITNDAAAAAKALAKDSEQSSAVTKYTNLSKDQMDAFMKMTPEEREQALLESMNMLDQADPGYMSTVMQTLFDADPETLRRMVQKQTQVLFDMSEEQRRGIMKMNMQLMGSITPEQQKMLQEDAAAIMKELQEARESGNAN